MEEPRPVVIAVRVLTPNLSPTFIKSELCIKIKIHSAAINYSFSSSEFVLLWINVQRTLAQFPCKISI